MQLNPKSIRTHHKMFRKGLATSWGCAQQAWGARGEENGWGKRGLPQPRSASTQKPVGSSYHSKVVMRNERSLTGQGKSDEHPPYEELTAYE
ncbi:hypothetical protein Taro_006400 [Colocasia esculenta]|uniref:Uncharacterized protein n=1 Tax=Colocasia esculenta TaxID=4460 RepID=A0A843TWX6_COLES|nr:hypothetical protein [Colocasia esculenta]